MTTSELLDGLLTLFQGEIPGADFLRGWPPAVGSRRRVRPAVTGEVDGETLKPDSQEVRFKFRIYLPDGEGADRAEELFAAMCTLAGQHYPGFSAISRGPAKGDRTTGLAAVECTLSFLTVTGGGGSEPAGRRITLGGREYTVTGVKTSVSRKGEELCSIGETVPFAVLGEAVEYTVELEGLDVSGLGELASFTAQIGGDIYHSCRWKTLSDVLRRGVFVSGAREEA